MPKTKTMTPAEFAQMMRLISDAKAAHLQADSLMCEVLESLGYGEGVEIFENMEKSYA